MFRSNAEIERLELLDSSPLFHKKNSKTRRAVIMQKIKIIPLVGIEFDDITIALYSSCEDVKNLLGEPYSTQDDSLYYFNNELRFDFDDDGKVEFIEFLGSIDGELQPMIYDVPAFQSKADTLYNILREENRGDIDDSEDGYSYGFLNISVGVYRSSIPKDVEEMIKEADEAGEPMDAGDIEEERRKADYWSTIGIGIKDYYR